VKKTDRKSTKKASVTEAKPDGEAVDTIEETVVESVPVPLTFESESAAVETVVEAATTVEETATVMPEAVVEAVDVPMTTEPEAVVEDTVVAPTLSASRAPKSVKKTGRKSTKKASVTEAKPDGEAVDTIEETVAESVPVPLTFESESAAAETVVEAAASVEETATAMPEAVVEVSLATVSESIGEEDECAVCGETETTDDNVLILCDKCDKAYHQQCCGIDVIPEGSWFCISCAIKPASKKRGRKELSEPAKTPVSSRKRGQLTPAAPTAFPVPTEPVAECQTSESSVAVSSTGATHLIGADLEKMTVVTLRHELKNLDLPTHGLKKDLVRFADARNANSVSMLSRLTAAGFPTAICNFQRNRDDFCATMSSRNAVCSYASHSPKQPSGSTLKYRHWWVNGCGETSDPPDSFVTPLPFLLLIHVTIKVVVLVFFSVFSPLVPCGMFLVPASVCFAENHFPSRER
jgi:hypothetical protein